MTLQLSILIVDSDPVYADKLQECLMRAGHEAHRMDSLQDAQEYMLQSELPHIVVLDIGLPDLATEQFILWLEQDVSDEIQIILCSTPDHIARAAQWSLPRPEGSSVYGFWVKEPILQEDIILATVQRAAEKMLLLQQLESFLENPTSITTVAPMATISPSTEGIEAAQFFDAVDFSHLKTLRETLQFGLDNVPLDLRDKSRVFFQIDEEKGQLAAVAFSEISPSHCVRVSVPMTSVGEAIHEELLNIIGTQHFRELNKASFMMVQPEIWPLVAAGRAVGVLVVDGSSKGFEKVTRNYLNQFAMALSHMALMEQLEQHRTYDSLTGALTKNVFREKSSIEIQRAFRLKHHYTLIAIKCAYGSQETVDAGLVRDIARVLQSQLRSQDLVSYDGSGVFRIGLCHAPFEQAVKKSEQLRDALKLMERERQARLLISGLNASRSRSASLSVSMGIASYPEHGSTVEDLLQASSNCLFMSQKSGPDQTMVAHTQL